MRNHNLPFGKHAFCKFVTLVINSEKLRRICVIKQGEAKLNVCPNSSDMTYVSTHHNYLCIINDILICIAGFIRYGTKTLSNFFQCSTLLNSLCLQILTTRVLYIHFEPAKSNNEYNGFIDAWKTHVLLQGFCLSIYQQECRNTHFSNTKNPRCYISTLGYIKCKCFVYNGYVPR